MSSDKPTLQQDVKSTQPVPPVNKDNSEIVNINDGNQLQGTNKPPQQVDQMAMNVRSLAMAARKPPAKLPWAEAQYYWRCIFFFTYLIVNIMVLISFMIFHFEDKNFTLTGSYDGLSFLASNLNQDPILDLQVVSGSTCPGGFTKLNFGTWKGSMEGCYCSGSGDLTQGSCSSSGCTSYPAYSARNYEKWNDGTMVWCAQYATDYVKSTYCDTGYTQCYNNLCFKDSLGITGSNGCPVSKVTITASADGAAIQTYTLTSGDVVNVFVDNTEPPLTQLKVSLNDLPCVIDNNPIGTAPYLLDLTPADGCGTLDKDASFESIATGTLDDLFTWNSFPANLVNQNGYQSVRQNTPAYFSQGRQFKVVSQTASCQQIDADAIQNAADAASRMNDAVSGTTIAAMVVNILFFLFAFLIFWGAWNQHRHIVDGFQSSALFRKFFIFTICGLTLIYIVMASLIWDNINQMTDSVDYFATVKACFSSPQPGVLIDLFSNTVDNTGYKLLRYTNALFSIGIFCTFMYLVPNMVDAYQWWKQKKANRIPK